MTGFAALRKRKAILSELLRSEGELPKQCTFFWYVYCSVREAGMRVYHMSVQSLLISKGVSHVCR
jgi:hypothetical protein